MIDGCDTALRMNELRRREMRTKRLVRCLLWFTGIVVLCLTAASAGVAGQSSPNFMIDVSVLSGGGGIGSSPNYSLSSAIGQSTPVGQSTSDNFSLNPGYFDVALNRAPIAVAGETQILACTDPKATSVSLDGSGSRDPDGDPLLYTWTGAFGSVSDVSPEVTLPLGKNVVSLVVNDGVISSLTSESVVQITADVQGLELPLGPLVPEDSELVMPDAAFKRGRTLPLRLQLLCGAMLLTDVDVNPPVLENVQRIDDSQNLDLVDIDTGQANDSGNTFRYADTEWIYNMSTKGLRSGTYKIGIRMPDGIGYQTLVVLQ